VPVFVGCVVQRLLELHGQLQYQQFEWHDLVG